MLALSVSARKVATRYGGSSRARSFLYNSTPGTSSPSAVWRWPSNGSRGRGDGRRSPPHLPPPGATGIRPVFGLSPAHYAGDHRHTLPQGELAMNPPLLDQVLESLDRLMRLEREDPSPPRCTQGNSVVLEVQRLCGYRQRHGCEDQAVPSALLRLRKSCDVDRSQRALQGPETWLCLLSAA